MTETQDWLRAVTAAHAVGADAWTQGRATVHRVAGGSNNALYRVEANGQSYACKLCVADERRRADREYGVLRLLHTAEVDIAPQPLCLDESCGVLPFPTVVYQWLLGEPLGASPTAQQLASLLESVHTVHALRQSDFQDADLPDAWFHWFDFEPYLAELHGFLVRYGTWLATTGPEGRDWRDRLARLVDSCTGFTTMAAMDPGGEHLPLRLCHVHPNLANAIWGEDGRLRWVDWEYSGWGDPALNLAELHWHAALADLSEAQRAWLRNAYRRPAGDPGFEERLAVWDCILVASWPFLVLRVLWSVYHGPDRVRLTRSAVDPTELRARLVRFIERAEHFAPSV